MSQEPTNDIHHLSRLVRPGGHVDVVVDTDTYNEIDDQFALAYALRSTEKMSVKAIYAAPFHNERSTGPADGMERSYNEILKILELCDRGDLKTASYRGSASYLQDERTAVSSDAAHDLVSRSQSYSADKPLYVIALGAITNIASALLLDPQLKDRIVVIFLGGHAPDWPDTREFNMAQDVAAARVVFGAAVPLVHIPCMGVASAFTLSEPEMDAWLRGRNALCDYLIDATVEAANEYAISPVWSRVIWDVTAVAWLISDELILDRIDRTPIPQFDHHYSFSTSRHFYRVAYQVERDKLLNDLVKKLRA